MLNSETWRAVIGWKRRYEVSCFGQVRSLDRAYKTAKHGKVTKFRGRILKQGTLKNGYRVVGLSKPGGTRHDVYVHHLVLESFSGPRPKNKEACHNNGVRHDNTPQNLRWDTRSNNALDRHTHGTMRDCRGERANSAKLNWKKVKWIRNNWPKFSLRKIGGRFGVCHKTVSAVIKEESWV